MQYKGAKSDIKHW